MFVVVVVVVLALSVALPSSHCIFLLRWDQNVAETDLLASPCHFANIKLRTA
jgi:hypothetical protein